MWRISHLYFLYGNNDVWHLNQKAVSRISYHILILVVGLYLFTLTTVFMSPVHFLILYNIKVLNYYKDLYLFLLWVCCETSSPKFFFFNSSICRSDQIKCGCIILSIHAYEFISSYSIPTLVFHMATNVRDPSNGWQAPLYDAIVLD